MAIRVILSIIILGFGIGGFFVLDTPKAALWLIFCVIAYPPVLAFTIADRMESKDLVELYRIGVKQIPIIGRMFK